MSPVTKIALRRIKRNWRKSVFLVIAILFSMLIISFFLFFELQTLITQNPAYQDLPFTAFLSDVRLYMNITVLFLTVITFLSVRAYCRMRNDENAETLAVLTSVGATEKQKRRLVITEMTVLYLPSTVLGVCAGMVPGVHMGNLFQGISENPKPNCLLYAVSAIGIMIAGMLLISLCCFLPDIKRKKRSVIQSVKKQNVKASEQRHGHRQSKTFQNQMLLKRLSRKSIDYYEKTYHNIALSFVSAALYPILAVLLFWYIGNSDMILDANPYDMTDTTAAVLAAVDGILLFLGGGFLILTCVGVLQAIFMTHLQMETRKESAHIYLSIGMTDSDIKKMIRLEIQGILFRTCVFLLFASLIVNACFAWLVG